MLLGKTIVRQQTVDMVKSAGELSVAIVAGHAEVVKENVNPSVPGQSLQGGMEQRLTEIRAGRVKIQQVQNGISALTGVGKAILAKAQKPSPVVGTHKGRAMKERQPGTVRILQEGGASRGYSEW